MYYTPRGADPLYDSLEPVVRGLDFSLVELSLSRHKGSVQIRAVVCGPRSVGVNDCSRVHRALIPRLELAFPGADLSVEVSSPGIDRLIKDGAEFTYYIGRGISCYRTDISGWSGGILELADETHIILKGRDGVISLPYESIAKAKLNSEEEARGNGHV
ncbi:MAG: ribosome assembly cofactor RimP [Treponema sp.]|nr:ribosome assembly cofactor RimP [Treponema sp.]